MGENRKTDNKSNSRELSDEAWQSCAPHANVQIKTGCTMPDSFGAVKKNWDEKSVSDENERTPEVEPKSTNPRQDDEKARWSCHPGGSPFPIFYRGGQKTAVLGIHVLMSDL